jgi:hypothetical protein
MEWEQELEKASKNEATKNNLYINDLFQLFNSTGSSAENVVANIYYVTPRLLLNKYTIQQWSPHIPSPPPQFAALS